MRMERIRDFHDYALYKFTFTLRCGDSQTLVTGMLVYVYESVADS